MEKSKFLGVQINDRDTWAIVDDKGNILEKFRTKCGANTYLPKLKMTKYEKLEIKRLLQKKRI